MNCHVRALAASVTAAALSATAEPVWDDALVVGRTNGDKCFYEPGEEMVFTLSLEGVQGDIPPGVYFYDWKRSANDGNVEEGRAPVEEPLVIRTRLDIPGFVKIEANVVTADGKLVPRKHLWEKRVFFQGGAGVAVDRLEPWPEPADYDEYWASLVASAMSIPLEVVEREKMPCANDGLDLYRMKIKAPEGVLPATGYLAVPKTASPANRMKATGWLSGYYNSPERCPDWLTNHVDGIEMYINRHGCELDQPKEYYEPFYGQAPYPPEHFRAMALRMVMMFRYLKTLPEWNREDLVAAGSSGGAMQALWAGMCVPGISRVEASAPGLADIFGGRFGRPSGALVATVEGNLYFDVVYAARRIPCMTTLRNGLGDYTCPPFGAAMIYANLRCPKQITWMQGTTHGWWPAGMAHETWTCGRTEERMASGAEQLTPGGKDTDENPLARILERRPETSTREDAAHAAELERLQTLAVEDAAVPVHPGGEAGRPFWNGSSQQFIYPPAFDFENVAGATKYRFTLIDDLLREHTMETAAPTAPLTQIWGEVPVGLATVICDGVDASGHICGRAGGPRRFWRAAPYRPGSYPKAARPYNEAATKIFDHVYEMENSRRLRDGEGPDPSYELNCYPAKMNTALIRAMVRYAALRPDRAEGAIKTARAAADWLLGVSQPADAPLAHFPPTYRGDKLTARDYAGQQMLLYPAQAASAYLDLGEATGDPKYSDAALAIGETYLALQGDDGVWPLKAWEKDGSSVVPNRCFPMRQVALFERLFALTGEPKWRTAADRAFAYIENGPLTTWNWEPQFEDVKPQQPYASLTKHDACDVAIYLLKRFPDDKARRGQARELARFAEDQFIYWERPCRADGTGFRTGTPPGPGNVGWLWDYKSWFTPGVGEQLGWEMPIDGSADKLIQTFLALYKAEENPLDLAKARTLGDAITNIQKDDGSVRTHWLMRPDADGFWINCLIATAETLEQLSAVVATDESGKTLRGVQLPARDTSADDFSTLEAWGATLVRYQMTRDFFRHGYGPDGYEGYRAWLEAKIDHLVSFVIPQCRKRGMKVVVDLHEPPGGRVPVLPEWSIYRNQEALDRFLDCWRMIAQRVKGNEDVVYGYDILNEPVQIRKPTTLDWFATQEAAARIIREIDPVTPIIVEANDWDSPEAFSFMRPLPFENVIYEVHVYRPNAFTHQGTASEPQIGPVWPDPEKGWDRDFLRTVLAPVREFEKNHGAKIYVGEFSAPAWAKGAETYLADCIALFREYGWDWTYHAFREWPGWSVEHEPVAWGTSPDCFRPSADNPRKRVLLDGLAGNASSTLGHDP